VNLRPASADKRARSQGFRRHATETAALTRARERTGDNIMDTRLETERLILRDMQRDDAEALFALTGSEAYCARQAIELRSLPDTARYIEEYLVRRGPDDNRRLFFFAATLRDGGAFIGQGSLMMSGYRIATLGFGVREDFWQQRYGTEIARRIVAFGFESVGLHRIRAEATVDHTGSTRLLQKIGMVREGVARDCIWARGQWWTEAQYAILESDFRSLYGKAA
jgi:RimJ/RimL family protein N-acetyltransferase